MVAFWHSHFEDRGGLRADPRSGVRIEARPYLLPIKKKMRVNRKSTAT
jgi:hypothetical protein